MLDEIINYVQSLQRQVEVCRIRIEVSLMFSLLLFPLVMKLSGRPKLGSQFKKTCAQKTSININDSLH